MTKGYLLYPAVFLISLAITYVIEKRLIPFLSNRAKQPIYEGGPSWHLSKKGTPTMGGIAFIVGITFALLISLPLLKIQGSDGSLASVLITFIFSLGNAFVGIFDDLTKLRKKENAGLSPIQKLIFQFVLAVIFLMARAHYLGDGTVVTFSFGSLDLGFLYYPLAIILLLGIVNCANLSDGVDGLAASLSLTVGTVFILLGLSVPEVTLISSALLGGSIGFLFFNVHPAKVFMGDTGSLFLGALAASLAFCFSNPFIVIFIGGVYVIEGISVIIQVAVYKLCGKRVFKMAPLHHHLEKCGVEEGKICVIAVVTTLILSAASYFIFGVAR